MKDSFHILFMGGMLLSVHVMGANHLSLLKNQLETGESKGESKKIRVQTKDRNSSSDAAPDHSVSSQDSPSEENRESGQHILVHHKVNTGKIEAFIESRISPFQLEVSDAGSVLVAFSGVTREPGRDDTDVFFRRFTPDGEWTDLVRISTENILDRAPALLAGPREWIHYAWLVHDRKTGKVGLKYQRSRDGGESWVDSVVLHVGVTVARVPVLQGDTTGNIYLYISNQPQHPGPERLHLYRSGNLGASWEKVDVGFQSAAKGSALEPQLDVGDAGEAGLVWLDQTPGGRAVVFSGTKNGGVTWSFPIPINDDHNRILSDPQFRRSGKLLFAAWLEKSGGKSVIYCDYSNDGGATWHDDEVLFHGRVSQVDLKSSLMQGRMVLGWRHHRVRYLKGIKQEGELLAYKLHLKGEGRSHSSDTAGSLTGGTENLTSFRGFDIVDLGDGGFASVFSKRNYIMRPHIYLSQADDPTQSFSPPAVISENPYQRESVWPQAERLNGNEMVVLYGEVASRMSLLQNTQTLGNLILTKVKFGKRDP